MCGFPHTAGRLLQVRLRLRNAIQISPDNDSPGGPHIIRIRAILTDFLPNRQVIKTGRRPAAAWVTQQKLGGIVSLDDHVLACV